MLEELSRRDCVKLTCACVSLASLLALLSCGGYSGRAAAEAAAGGNVERGVAAINRYGCGTCHTISGVRGANGQVGPPLTGIASRVYIGGVLENKPENMLRWIQNPRAVDALTAMPVLGVTEQDARDIASFLYTLK
ncbi:MAG TPA: c-type cytochrome [Pyrinomonadaceae bacterium]|nr:c-type cytochrome [Pyrinomonadaceae bacterium]